MGCKANTSSAQTSKIDLHSQVSGTDDVKGGMQAVLDCFHDWLQEGAGGAGTWSLEPENHEGWRVSIDEGAISCIKT